MGQQAQQKQETTEAMMEGYLKNLDALTEATNRNVLPTEQSLLNARRIIGPQQTQFELEQMQKYLPQFTDIGLQQSRQQQLGQAGIDRDVLAGPGKELVAANLEAQRIADPEFYRTREMVEGQLGRLDKSLEDPDAGLSPTERAEIERSTAQTNAQRGLESPTGTSAVESAMNFGRAGAQRKTQKQQAIAGAVETAGQVMPQLRSGVDVLQLTTGRPSMPNYGVNAMQGNREVGSTTMGMGSQLLGQIGENARQTADINSRKQTGWSRGMELFNSLAEHGAPSKTV